MENKRRFTLSLLMLFALTTVIILSSSKDVYSQFGYRNSFSRGTNKMSVGLSAGTLTYYGDVSPDVNNPSPGQTMKYYTSFGYALSIDKRVGSILGFSANFLRGKLTGEDINKSNGRSLNFQTDLTIQGEVNIFGHFEKLLNLGRRSKFSPFVTLGFAYFLFEPKMNLRDADDNLYHYWLIDKEIFIRDRAYNYNLSDRENFANSAELTKDKTYESEPIDWEKVTSGFSVPFGLGFKMNLKNRAVKISKNFDFFFHWKFYYSFSDDLDGKNSKDPNVANKYKDHYVFTSAGLMFDVKGFQKSRGRRGKHRRFRSKF